MKNKIVFIAIITLVFMILLIPLKGSYAFYSDSKDLEIINTKVGDWNTLIGYLRINDKNNNLSSTIQGDMYRYQGTDGVNNWICFGTTENCGTNDELIDKYMYRIIGITEEGQLKLLKETFLKEGDVTLFAWNDKYYTSGAYSSTCDNKICPEWGSNTLFKRINGTSNGTTPGNGSYSNNADTDIFVDNEYYDYLKSGDSYNGTKDEKGSSWYQLIESHDWMYGDTNERYYNGDQMYEIETGQADVKHIVGTDGNVEEKTYNWTEKATGKISLMYVHDYTYSYYDGVKEQSRGNPGSSTNIKNSWIYFQKDGYNLSHNYEWLSTRFGIFSTSNLYVGALRVFDGALGSDGLRNDHGVRPVFYLNTDVIIIKGAGTKANPFIIQN